MGRRICSYHKSPIKECGIDKSDKLLITILEGVNEYLDKIEKRKNESEVQ